MRAVRLAPNPVACRYCGATAARPHGNPYGMCNTCYGDFALWVIPDDQSEQTALMFLARSMRLASVRVTRDQIFGRCECISKSWHKNAAGEVGTVGYQCGSPSKHLIDGVKVCGSHAYQMRNGNASLVRDHLASADVSRQYDYFIASVSEIIKADPDFRAALERALQ